MRLVVFSFLGCWGILGFLIKQISEKKIEQLSNLKNTTAALNEMNNIYTSYALIMTVFGIIQGFYFLRLGVKTMSAGVFPPPGLRMPFRTKIQQGLSAKVSGIGCIFAGLVNFTLIVLLFVLRHELYKNI
jgi:hypothetical protein